MADGLDYLVSSRFLSESLVIEAVYSITNYGVPLKPPGLSYMQTCMQLLILV